MTATSQRSEQYSARGEELVSRVRELVREGNVRRIIIKNDDGRSLIELPLTIGVIGALLLPAWAALGAIAALVTDCTIEVEREGMSGFDPHVGEWHETAPHHPTAEELAAIPEEERFVDDQC